MTDQEALFVTDEAIQKDALLSPCGRYRYWLTREWGPGATVVFVMLNPSIADAAIDDPTIRRCIGFARSWGYGALAVVNLYALRSTDPKGLWLADDPVGPDNDMWLTRFATGAEATDAPVVAAWGANARTDRIDAVKALSGMHRLSALGLTKDGQPRHPLYLKADLRPVPLGSVHADGLQSELDRLEPLYRHVLSDDELEG
jgi:hypothetical protein